MKIAKSVSLLILLTALFSFEIKAQIGLSPNNLPNKYSLLLNKNIHKPFKIKDLQRLFQPHCEKHLLPISMRLITNFQ